MTQNLNISSIIDQQRIAESMLIDIDDWCENEYLDGHREHLGGSMIGKSCSRQLWYGNRWVKKPDYSSEKKTNGQVMRLFQRGHREERWFTEYLIGIGCKLDATPENQFRISDIEGHFGGSMDNVGYLPERYGIEEKILFEFKTLNMANYTKLNSRREKTRKAGVLTATMPDVYPVYWSQVCVYGYKMGLKYVYFMAQNKNDDSLYIEIITLDHEHAQNMIDKAGAIITAQEPPQKISLHRTDFNCKWCSFRDICHDDEPIEEKNCRSCKNCTAGANKTWLCQLNGNQAIPQDFIKEGCDKWTPIA